AIGRHLGAMYLAIGCLAAVYSRQRDGLGQQVDVAEFDCLVSSLTNFVANYELTGEVPAPLGNRHVFSSPWNVYQTSDGHIVICVVSDRQWTNLAHFIGAHEIAENHEYLTQQNRRQRAETIDAVVGAWTSTRRQTEALSELRALG